MGFTKKTWLAIGGLSLFLILVGIVVFAIFGQSGVPETLTEQSHPSLHKEVSQKQSTTSSLKESDIPQGILSIFVVGLGLYPELTEEALNLPQEIMLGYYLRSPEIASQIENATSKGFDVYMMCPMEPVYYPHNDPGPNTLLTGLPAEENLKRLNDLLSISPAIKGLVSYQGSLFMTSEEDLSPIMKALAASGKIFVDSSNAPQSKIKAVCHAQKATCYQTIFQLDQELSGESLKKTFKEIEKALESNERVIIFGFAYPITLEALTTWLKESESKIKLEKLPTLTSLREAPTP
jgi:polysaccharide deacetylase 2 family uncharacterized protein YibQ